MVSLSMKIGREEIHRMIGTMYLPGGRGRFGRNKLRKLKGMMVPIVL